MEGLYLQQVKKEDLTVFSALESTILHELIPNLFCEDKTDAIRQEVLFNPIHYWGTTITNLITTSTASLHTLEVCTAFISSALMKMTTFNCKDHFFMMAARQTAALAAKDASSLDTSNKIIAVKGLQEAKILARADKSGR